MKKLFLGGIFLALSIFYGCNTDENKIVEKHAVIMEIHDDVMPKLAEMNKLSRTLKDKVS